MEANRNARLRALGGRAVPTTAIIVETLRDDWLVESRSSPPANGRSAAAPQGRDGRGDQAACLNRPSASARSISPRKPPLLFASCRCSIAWAKRTAGSCCMRS